MRLTVLSVIILLNLTVQAQEKYIITSDSVQLYVKVKGTGPACLYIHGGPGSGSNWMDMFMGDSLEHHFQMIYLDQRGVGRSSSPSDNNYSLELMVKDFEEVRISLGIKEWLTIGHSFGGILQTAYVKSNPEVIAGLMFINCTLDMNDSFGKSWLHFYYGETDWAIGPEHYKEIKFPEMVLWGSKVGHMPFLEDKADLMKAIIHYKYKYF